MLIPTLVLIACALGVFARDRYVKRQERRHAEAMQRLRMFTRDDA